MQRRNAIAPKYLFIDKLVIERANPPALGPTVETRKAKKARESRFGSAAGASSSAATDNSLSSRMQSLEERLDRLIESTL